MRPCFHIEIETPKKVLLNGLWFGSKRAKTVFILVHGLTGSAFSMQGIVDALADRRTAVMTFNNRGFEQVTSVKRRKRAKSEYVTAGTAHEIFTDAADDIDGTIAAARTVGAQHIYLIGHSTGCQKIVYWASVRRNHASIVDGMILLGPLSDRSGMVKARGGSRVERDVMLARSMVRAGHPHEFVPKNQSDWFLCDAQRYVSLYARDSDEHVFPYAEPDIAPERLRAVRVPVCVFLAGRDEYGDQPARAIAKWFGETIPMRHDVYVVAGVRHGFKGGEAAVASAIRAFMK